MKNITLSKNELNNLIFENVSVKILEAITQDDFETYKDKMENPERYETQAFQQIYTPDVYDSLVKKNAQFFDDDEKLSKSVRANINSGGKSDVPKRIKAVQDDITQNIRKPGDEIPNYDNMNITPNGKLSLFYQEVKRTNIGKLTMPEFKKFIEKEKKTTRVANGKPYKFFDKNLLPNTFSECPERIRVLYGSNDKGLDMRYLIKRTMLNKYEVRGDTFTYGNTKLPPNILIINLNSGTNCPNKHSCKFSKHFKHSSLNEKKTSKNTKDNQINAEVNEYGVCYAQKDEIAHTDVELRNIRNELMFERIEFNDLIRLIEEYIETSHYRVDYCRINESGDFKNEMQVKAANVIAGYLKKKYNINTSCYCNNISLIGAFTNAKNLILNASSTQFNDGATRFYFAMREPFFDDILKDKGGDNKIKQRKKANGEIQDYFICCCNCYKCALCYKTAKEAESEYGQMKGNEGKLYVYSHIH